MEISVVFEDNALLVIDKPSGVVVNRAESVKEKTIQDWAQERIKICRVRIKNKEEAKEFYNRAGIVHRLDKDTSGLLIIAKTPEAFSNLQSQFKERVIEKKYQALVHGVLAPKEGGIKANIARLPWNREKFGIVSGGRAAFTSYKVVAYYKGLEGNFSLLEVFPETGRTHQIRVHLKYLGFPVVSDSLYGGRKTWKRDLKFCPRLFLHAAYLKFKHPEDGRWIEVKSELPEDLKKVLEFLLKEGADTG